MCALPICLIAAQSKGLQVESVMYMTSRALQSLQNQINQLLNSAKATALAAENQPTAAAVYVYDKTLGAGVNTVSFGAPLSQGDSLTVFLISTGVAGTLTWGGTFSSTTHAQYSPLAGKTTVYSFRARINPASSVLLWFQCSPAETL